jgi:hypothetical protein
MSGAIPPLPNTPSWRGAQLKTQGQLYLYLLIPKLYIEELHKLYVLPNSVRVIKSRMRWAGDVARMGEIRNVYKIMVGKHEGKRQLGNQE